MCGVSLVEPGATAKDLAGNNRPGVLESIPVADAITYIATRPGAGRNSHRGADSPGPAGAVAILATAQLKC